LSVVPVRVAPGEPVVFNLNVTDRAANGALGYIVRFGDGASHANVIPMFCLAGKGRPEHEAWRLTHRYARAGTYQVSATGYANCGPDRSSVARQLVVT
jgi:PKD domain